MMVGTVTVNTVVAVPELPREAAGHFVVYRSTLL